MEERMNRIHGPSEQSFDQVAFNRMKADALNREKGILRGYDCPKWLNKGDIVRVREDGSLVFSECGCMNLRRCVTKMERSGLKDVISDYTFDRFVVEEPWQEAVKSGAQNYADDPQGWLLLCGQSGSGKTHLCVAVCRKLLLEGKEVLYMPWRQELRELKAMESEGQITAIQKLQKAPVLYVDDLYKTGRAADGSCNPTAADVNYAFEILNYRYTNRLTTIISTERTPEELVKIDEATGGRMVEMARNHTFCISKKTGRNYRLRGMMVV